MKKHEKFFVDSSFIQHVSWDEKTHNLIVTFASGSIWLYQRVPKTVYKTLISSESVGAYFNKYIRNHYDSTVVARVGKSSVIIYSKGEELGKEEKTQEQI